MNVAALLQDSPSDDHRRRQEIRDREKEQYERERREREEEREREREREKERERERERDWDRDRDRDRLPSSASSAPLPPPPQTHRSYSPIGSTLPLRPRIHSYDGRPPPPPSSRAAQTPGSDSLHARSYSQDSRPPSASHALMRAQPPSHPQQQQQPHSHSHSPPAPSTALNTSPAEYAQRSSSKMATPKQMGTPPVFSQSERDRDRERERERDQQQQRTRSLSGSARPRSPPYGDFRDAPGRVTPSSARGGPGQHTTTTTQGSYSVVPPQQPTQHYFSSPQSSSHNNNNSSSSRKDHAVGRRGGSVLPVPPSASVGHSHDRITPTASSAMHRPFEELPYPQPPRAPSSSSSVMSAGRTLKEDIERERETIERGREREREKEREREREREREMQRKAHSRSASAGAGAHASPPNVFSDRLGEREREMVELERMNRDDMDAIRAAAVSRMQGQPRDAREREREREREAAARHHLHHHHHSSTSSLAQSHPNQSMLSHQQQQQQQQQQSHVAGTPYTYAHTGKPRISRSGVLKLAPPGVTVPNTVPPSSSDNIFAGAPGVVLRQETLTLVPSATGRAVREQQQQQAQQQQQQASHQTLQVLEPTPVSVKQLSPPPTSLHLASEVFAEGAQAYGDGPGPQGYAEGAPHQMHHHSTSHPSQKPKSYSVVPTGPGVPPQGGGPPAPTTTSMQASIIAAQQQQQQQHAQQFGPMPASLPPHQQVHHPLSHTQSLPPPPMSSSSSSSNGHVHHPQHNPYRQMPPQHQGYPPNMHYNEVPPPPVPMALQPMPPSPTALESLPMEPPVDLGTFVFPHTPFPYFFPARGDGESQHATAAPSNSPGQSRKTPRREMEIEQRERATHLTILIPSTHLPSSLPTDGKPRIWGGAASSAPDSWSAYVNYVTRAQPVTGGRRVYTDDSDVLLCALHGGHVSWAGVRRARAVGLDLKVRVALHREVGRFVGGPCAFVDGSVGEGSEGVDVGLKKLLEGEGKGNGKGVKGIYEDGYLDRAGWMMMHSASWESGHDGSGIEILGTEWLPHGSTHKRGLRNRRQRLQEYAEQRQALFKNVPTPGPSSTVLGKRPLRRFDPLWNIPVLPVEEQEMAAARTVVFGKCREAESLGFKYDPAMLRSALFPPMSSSSSISRQRGRRKRRKLNGTAATNGVSDLLSELESDVEMIADRIRKGSPSPRRSKKTDIILENEGERFLLRVYGSGERREEDKENCDGLSENVDLTSGGKMGRGGRYNLYALPASPPPSAPVERPVSPKIIPAVNTNGVAKTDVMDVPMTPKSDGSEPGSPRATSKEKDAEGVEGVGEVNSDAAEAAKSTANGTVSELKKEASAIPTPPATTETVVAVSPLASPRSSSLVKDRSEDEAKVLQILYRDLNSDSVQFVDGGLSITGVDRILENGADSDKKGMFIHVERWRWASPREGGREAVTV